MMLTGIESIVLLVLGIQLTHGKLLWSDEFSSRKSLAGWNVMNVENSHNSELQYYTTRNQNADVRGGHLVLTPRRERYGSKQYTSARLHSKFAWKYGRVQVRAKLPKGYGLWPAIWMMPRDSVYGGWPRSGEIDIIEARGQYMNQIQSTIHFQGSETSGDLRIGCAVDQWHLYEMVWSPTEMVFMLDGKRYHSFNLDKSFGARFKKKGQPFDQYFYLILNVAVGGHYVEDPRPDTVWRYPDAEMWVDYVRVYSDMDIPTGGGTANCPCKAKQASSYEGVCGGSMWACNSQNAADVSSKCTARLRHCCKGRGCSVKEVRGLASAVYESYDSQLRAGHSCDFGGTAEHRCDSSGPRCLIKDDVDENRICGAVRWACGPANTFANVSPQCRSAQDALNCCIAKPSSCENRRLREAAGAVFQAYYDAIPIDSSCDFGGVSYLVKARSPALKCVDGYGK